MQHHINDLSTHHLPSDSSFVYKIENIKLSGLSGTYLGELLRDGDSDFKKLSKSTEKRFNLECCQF